MVNLTEEQKNGNPLRVTRGDGVPLENQAAGIEAFKRQCLAPSETEALQARVVALEKYIRKLDSYIEHRESCRSNGISGPEWSISTGGKCNCGLAKVLETEPR